MTCEDDGTCELDFRCDLYEMCLLLKQRERQPPARKIRTVHLRPGYL